MTKPDLYASLASDRSKMRIGIAGHMIKGAIVAGVVFFGPIVFIVALAYAGTLLPPESKEAADPTPDSFGIIE